MTIQEKLHSLTPPIGVIDSLALGLEAVVRRPLLLLLPLVLDMFFWLGPRLSFRPLLGELVQSVAKSFDPLSLMSLLVVLNLSFPMWAHNKVWEPISPPLTEAVQGKTVDMSKVLEGMAQTAPDQYLDVYMPSVVGGRDAISLPFDYLPPVWQIQTTTELVALRLVLLLAGLVLWTIYLAIVAQWIREKQSSLGWMIRRVPIVFFQILIVLIMAVVALFLLALVFSAIEVIGALVGLRNIHVWFLLLVFMAGSWVLLFIAFTIHGMYLNDRGIFSAAWDSLRVVQWNMSSTMGLFLSILIVLMARYYIKDLLDPGSWLTGIAIVVNAFLCTGLLASTFVFFKDRYRYWRELREKLLAELESRRIQQSKS